jgi:putative FmdB family regulatory protein
VPTYEYRCTSCDNAYEKHEGFDAPARQDCPRCGGLAKRVIFPPPIVFKGKGFYVTDSRKGDRATVTGDANGGSSSDGKASESKPAPAAADTSSSAATD